MRWRDSIIIKNQLILPCQKEQMSAFTQLSLPCQRVRVSGGHLCATAQKHRPSRQVRRGTACGGGIQYRNAVPGVPQTTITQTTSCLQVCFISALPMLHTPSGAHRSAQAVMSFYPLSRQSRQLPLITLKREPLLVEKNALS